MRSRVTRVMSYKPAFDHRVKVELNIPVREVTGRLARRLCGGVTFSNSSSVTPLPSN